MSHDNRAHGYDGDQPLKIRRLEKPDRIQPLAVDGWTRWGATPSRAHSESAAVPRVPHGGNCLLRAVTRLGRLSIPLRLFATQGNRSSNAHDEY